MGAWGALIMGFFGAVFATLTMFWQWHIGSFALALPFVVFALIGMMASFVIRLPGAAIEPSPRAGRTIVWSTVAEGIGLFLVTNIVINLHRPDLLLPAMALVVGLHFLPIAAAAAFRPFYLLGTVLIAGALAGVAVAGPTGGVIAGFTAAGGLWLAAIIAVRRDWRSKQTAAAGG